MQSQKKSRIFNISAVVIMGVDKGVNEAHHNEPILETSKENLGDQVMEKMASPWWCRGVLPI